MKKISLKALSTKVLDDQVYSLVKQGEKLTLLIFDENLKAIDEVWSGWGNTGFILMVKRGEVYASIDDKLCLIKNGSTETVLKATNSANIFWHLTEADGKLFVHEYGKSPTSIYLTEDLRNWKKIVTNLDIDKQSKHFHDISYDPIRKILICTLGDGCLTRVAFSKDFGLSWKPLYSGPWQFVPILAMKDKLMFGMDSGIAKGGIGSYNFTTNQWNFTFLKWQGKDVKFVQMSDLKLLTNELYIAGLGQPQAIVISKDARRWHLVCAEGFDEQFNMYINIGEGKEFITCSTGKSLLLVAKNELESLCKTTDPVISDYKLGFIEKLKGLEFNIKHRLIT